MTPDERESALQQMQAAVARFYRDAVKIGNHPFVEFAGVMTAYVDSCRRAHQVDVDFSECNQHAGRLLPIESFDVEYLTEKLNCIFGGRISAGIEASQSAPTEGNAP